MGCTTQRLQVSIPCSGFMVECDLSHPTSPSARSRWLSACNSRWPGPGWEDLSPQRPELYVRSIGESCVNCVYPRICQDKARLGPSPSSYYFGNQFGILYLPPFPGAVPFPLKVANGKPRRKATKRGTWDFMIPANKTSLDQNPVLLAIYLRMGTTGKFPKPGLTCSSPIPGKQLAMQLLTPGKPGF